MLTATVLAALAMPCVGLGCLGSPLLPVLAHERLETMSEVRACGVVVMQAEEASQADWLTSLDPLASGRSVMSLPSMPVRRAAVFPYGGKGKRRT